MNDGGALYVEGSDVGCSHYTTEFFEYLGADYIRQGDGYNTINEIEGVEGTFTAPDLFSFPDGDPDYKVDELGAGEGTGILRCQEDIVRTVLYEGANYRAITSSVTFGVLENRQESSTRALLMERYLNFLNGNDGSEFWCSHGQIDFGVQYISYDSVINITMQNFGQGGLYISDIGITGEQFSIDCETSYSLASGQRIELPVRFYSDEIGYYMGAITLTTNDPDETSVTIPVEAECFGSPVVGLEPTAFNVDILADQITQRIMTIANSGESRLSFNIQIVDSHELVGTTDHRTNDECDIEAVSLAKGEYDYRQGPPVVCGSGGPDDFGYKWIDSDEAGGPVYQWFDISEIGQNTGLEGDDEMVTIPLPFGFHYYGNEYDEVTISTNGYLTFGNDGEHYGNHNIPYSEHPNNIICPFWDDLEQESGSNYSHYDQTNHRFIIQYQDWGFYSGGGSLDFQVHLLENGVIFFYYRNLIGSLTSATIGIENSTGADGLQVAYNSNYLHDEMAIQFNAGPIWITMNESIGIVPVDSTHDIIFTFDATSVDEGVYTADIIFGCNDPETPRIVVPVTMNVNLTGIGDESLPYVTELTGNYPNPFNNSTVISYSIDKRTHVSLDIYNLLGQKIVTLVDDIRDAGEYREIWQADVSTGVYFYRLNAGDYVSQRKMILLK